jgi:4-pyridoxate dehydrogenase
MPNSQRNNRNYDVIIIGAGSAGCTLAGRLSEDKGRRILLVEAGGWDTDPWIKIPLGWPHILLNRKHDWMYFAEPEATTGGRGLECARGRVIGGSSSINAMAYVRGNQGDYERWAASGLKTWSYAHVLPYFRRQESWKGGPSFYRGGDGPLTTRMNAFSDPLIDAYAASGRAAGYKATPDYNGAQQEGFGVWQMTSKDGRRCSAADAYLRPALERKNLTVETDALTTKIIFDGRRAVGIEYIKNGETVTAHAAREVILCSGVVNSPQLLMLSGIGDPAELAQHDIAVKVALPGVGKNLQDHISAAIAYQRKTPGPFHRAMRIDRILPALARAYYHGEGIATDLPGGIMAFLKSRPDALLPDVQLIFNAAPMTAHPYLWPFRRPYADGYACRAVVLRPESRGRVELASADPRKPVRIRQNFLATDNDWKTLRAGLRIARDVCRQAPLAPFMDREIAPGETASDDAGLDAHIRANSITVHHPLGTCKMGLASDSLAVVDPELKVLGVDGLRVVDGSVMPDLVGANINAPIIMIAEKAADLIRGRPPLEAARITGATELSRP